MPPILIIEDDLDSRELLSELLQAHGYATLEAANGREGLDCLDRSPALSLILLDLMMPVMDGWEFRRQQLEHPVHRDVPVVVVTADTRMNGRAADLRAAALLTKPLDIIQVLDWVRRHTGTAPPGRSA